MHPLHVTEGNKSEEDTEVRTGLVTPINNDGQQETGDEGTRMKPMEVAGMKIAMEVAGMKIATMQLRN